MFNGFSKKISLYLTFLLLLVTPFLFVPFIDEKIAFRVPKEAFSLFIISIICGLWGIRLIEESLGQQRDIAQKAKPVLLIKGNELPMALLLFCSYFLISSLFSDSPALSSRVSFNIFAYSLFFIYLMSNITKPEESALLRKALLLPGVIMSIYSIFQYYGYDPLFQPVEPYMKKFLLASGFIDNPNLFAGYLVVVIPISLAEAITAQRKRVRLLSIVSLIFLLTALLLTNARTGFISFLGSTLFFFLMKHREGELRKIVFTGGIIALLLSGIFMLTNRYYMAQSRERLELPDKSFDVRLVHWKSAWLMISESPQTFLFGKGPGTFKLHYLDYRIQATKDLKRPLSFENSHYAHNEYIQLWAEAGMLGLLLAGALLFVFTKTVLPPYFAEKNASTRYISSGYLASFLAILINSLASFPLHIIPSTLVAVTAAALSLTTLKDLPVSKHGASASVV